MGWIVDIRNAGAALKLIESREGVRREVSAEDASLDIEDIPKGRRTRFVEVDLAAFTSLDATEARSVVTAMAIPESVAEVQSFLKLQDGVRTIVVPSQVFIHALVGSSRAHRSTMLAPAGFQLLACLTEGPEGLEVTFQANFEKKPPERAVGLTSTILWTGSYPSARKMHASVLRHALNGRFDIDLPKARVTLSFSGAALPGGELLATRVRVGAVEPLEPPMVHAGKAPAKFVFAEVDRRRLQTGGLTDALRGPKDIGADPNLADERFATPLLDAEWDSVREILARHRSYKRALGEREREKVDLILRKLSTGLPWTKVTGSPARGQLVQRYLRDLEANGSWAAVKALMLKARGNGASSDASTVDDFSPTGLRRIRTHIAKMTQPEFAALLQVSATTVSGWERGEREPKGAVTRRVRLLLLGGVEALRQQGG